VLELVRITNFNHSKELIRIGEEETWRMLHHIKI
jgi:hypothetical protein